jgi:hypothetical protein
MKIQHVPVEWVNRTWDMVEEFVSSALEHSKGDYTADQIKTFLVQGRWLLLVAVDDDNKIQGAATIDFFNRPNDRVAFIVTMGGKLITNPDTFEQLKLYLVSNGATVMECTARESTARLWERYGLAEKYRIVGVKL